MSCWGLLGLLVIVSQWIIPENSLRLAPVSKWIKIAFGCLISVAELTMDFGRYNELVI